MAVTGFHFARTVRFAWDANDAGDEVTNYNLYWGSAEGVYNAAGSPLDVGNVTTVRAAIFGTGATVHAALTAENASGESDFSEDVPV